MATDLYLGPENSNKGWEEERGSRYRRCTVWRSEESMVIRVLSYNCGEKGGIEVNPETGSGGGKQDWV